MQIHPKVTHINIWWDTANTEVGAYFIKGQKNTIIDTGPANYQDSIALALKPLGLRFDDIDIILNTHGHADHTGGNATIKDASGALCMIHESEVSCLENREHWFDQQQAPVVEALRGKSYLGEEKSRFLQSYQSTTVDRQLNDKDLIDIGDGIEIQVIHLPGHTPGSVGYYWETEGILFCGDSMVGRWSEGGSLPLITDLSAYQRSIDRLLGMPLRLLLCSHPYRGLSLPGYPIRQGEEIKQYLYESLETAKRISDTIKTVAPDMRNESLLDITDKVVAELPEEWGFKPVAELHSPVLSATTVFWNLRRLGSL